jgi:hypothetical protein
LVFDNKLRRGIPTVQEEAKASASMSADVDASFGLNFSTKSSTMTQGENKMDKTIITKTDTVKLQLRASVILTITFVLALTLLTASSIFNASSHGSAYCLTERPASAGIFVYSDSV